MTGIGAVGLFDGAVGVAWPSMRSTFDQPLAALGVVLLAYTGGYFVTSALGGWLLEHVGTGAALLGVASTAATGALLFAAAPVLALVLAGAVLLGMSGGAADLTLNHELAQHHGVRALGFLHAAWGLGAAAGPIIVSVLVAGGRSWRYAFVPIVVLQLSLLVGYSFVRRDWHEVPRRVDEGDDAEPWDLGALAIALGLFLLYVGVEAGTGAWGFTLLTDGRHLPDRTAGAWMSAYWLSLTGGRLLLGIAGDRLRPDTVLSASVLGAVGASVLLWIDPAGAGSVALVPLGASLAAVFPVLVAVTPERLGIHRAARAIGVQIAASAVGGVAIPSVIGVGAQAWGAGTIAPMLVSGAIALAALHGAGLRRQLQRQR